MDDAKVVVSLIHPVDDFEAWKRIVLERVDPIMGAEVVRRTVYRSVDEPNEVLIQVEFASEKEARAHLRDKVIAELDASAIEMYPPAFAGVEVAELRIDTSERPVVDDPGPE